jgi:5-enolpyruvylshikimate-3-phosphate synthase
MVDDLNSLKIIGNAELQERPIEEVIYHLRKIFVQFLI